MSNPNPSRPVESAQKEVHEHLTARLERQRARRYERPVADHNRLAFDAAHDLWEDFGRPSLVLDAGCGTGVSTAALARAHPDALVVGVDKSRTRLSRSPRAPDNAVLIRADLVDFWRVAGGAGWQLRRHYLLYPNPWPKPAHVARRWHAHPVFRSLLDLGGILEMRTNWAVYAREFRAALDFHGYPQAGVTMLPAGPALSPFERKYQRSEHNLYVVKVDLES